MYDSLEGQTSLVTGASAGFGKATARKLASEGSSVVVAARREERLRDLKDEIETAHDVSVLVVPTDISEEDQVEKLIEETTNEFNSLDIVVNNAGVGHGEKVETLSTETYRNVMGANVDGAFFTTRASIPHVRDANGTIIFIGSIAGQYPTAIYPVYAAAKWWTRGFALSLAGEIGGDDIAVSVINPTGVRTEFGSEYRDPNYKLFDEDKFPEPEDVANAVAFVAKHESPTAIGELDVYRRWEFEDG